MRCPICNYQDTKVIDSRMASDGMSIRRRRECERCDYRFSTMEEMELLDLMVVKRDGRREPYSREKLERGLRKALEKRQYTDLEFQKLIHSIERDVQKKKRNELRSSEIGEMVMNRLRSFDKVAYIRFASVYRAFEDVKTFQQELNALLGKERRRPRKSKRKKR
ncbi:transcriptional repressor NrdR [Candidatus Uhrbacteria bacterium]|nr:transcriptional repressor NrdR [Candidatus Uhrbacteria bacterium]